MRKQSHINIEIGGEGGKSSSPTLRHLLNSTCEISSVTSSHLTLQQHNAITRRVAPGRGGIRAATQARREMLRQRSSAGWAATRHGAPYAARGMRRAVQDARRRRAAAAPPWWRRSAPQQAPQQRTQWDRNGPTISSHSLRSVVSQSGHSRVTVGSQSGHSGVTVGS